MRISAKMAAILTLFVSMSFIIANCGGSEGDESISGTYIGSATDNTCGEGQVQVSLLQIDTALNGTWQSTFTDSDCDNGGSLSGTVIDKSIQLTLSPSNNTTCPFHVTANKEGNRIVGTYAAFNCNEVITGSINLKKD